LLTNLIRVSELKNKTPRTLVYGYTLDRSSFHVYLDSEGLLHRRIYKKETKRNEHISATEVESYKIVPSKRTYPECCDFEFAMLMGYKSVDLNFTTFNPNIKPQQFHGLTADLEF
jgi:hypothetical protein